MKTYSPYEQRSRIVARVLVLVIAIQGSLSTPAQAQLQITEVMYHPNGNQNLWEWVEVRNTSASSLDLNEWVFDDDDDLTISETAGPNILATNGNTVIPPGGVAVIYAGSNLNYAPERFTNAWGSGITLIPVRSFTSLTDADAIGFWPSYTAYDAETIEDPEDGQPRRTFANAAASLDFSSGFPTPTSGRSIAWKGVGDPSMGANWVLSETGPNGTQGSYQELVSVETVIASTPINSTLDRANPGIVPGGTAPNGLRITEVMFDPRSPESDWEWVEVHNGSVTSINFANTKYVLHDNDGADFAEPNITTGSVGPGGTAVLFNASAIAIEEIEAAWGSGINYIPVTAWGNGFANTGDTIAIWDSIEDYNLDKPGSGRTTSQAISVVNYDSGTPWPAANDAASFYLRMLDLDPNDPASWARSADEDALNSFTANEVLGTVIDHPGGDIGSPGKLGTASVGDLVGDYNDDGRVDAVDYTVWRNNFGQPANSIQNRDQSNSGPINATDYAVWKSHYLGSAPGGGGIAAAERVPEPGAFVLVMSITASLVLGRTPQSGQHGRAMYRR